MSYAGHRNHLQMTIIVFLVIGSDRRALRDAQEYGVP
jgi:hypothetical protein